MHSLRNPLTPDCFGEEASELAGGGNTDKDDNNMGENSQVGGAARNEPFDDFKKAFSKYYNRMQIEPELCPMCKNGYLRPTRKATSGESDEPLTPTVHIRDLECDKCGHIQKAASLTE